MRNFIVLFISTVIVTGTAYSQEQQKTTHGGRWNITLAGEPQSRERLLKEMKLIYTEPDGFNVVHQVECFDNNPQLRRMLSCLINQLVSSDGEFVAFYPLHRPFNERDSIDINRISPGSIRSLNGMHLGNLKHEIGKLHGGESARAWKNYVNYYPTAEAKTKFNADTAVSYSGRLDPSALYRDKYTHVGALYLQKKGRGYARIYFFYTDKAKENLSQYWKPIEGLLRYED